MSTPAAFVLYIGLVLLFALIGGIIIKHSLKQEEKRKAIFSQKFWATNNNSILP